MTAFQGNQDSLFEEMRTEIADLKQALHATEVEVKLLEERVENQESQQNTAAKNDLATLQKKVSLCEKSLDKLSADIRSLMAYANQTTNSLSQYRDHILELDQKFQEISKLRSMLSQISRSSVSSDRASQKYIVKSGDSLEKIARRYHISLQALKQENHLTSDKIIIGQELSIPHQPE